MIVSFASRWRKPRPAFTLIELLVVVAIIGILISILLPSLSAAKAEARTRVCNSNLRQLAIGFRTYATEWKDHLPGSTDDYIGEDAATAIRLCWLGTYKGTGGDKEDEVPSKGTIYRYVGENPAVYKCPEDKTNNYAERPDNSFREKTLYSYTVPKILTGAPVGLLKRTRWPQEFTTSFNWKRAWARGKTTGISHPWMILEEDEAYHLAYTTDSAWGNNDRISERHKGKGAIGHIDGSISLRRFQRQPETDAWKVFYELEDGRVVTSGTYVDNAHGGVRLGYLSKKGIAAEANLTDE